MVIVPSKSVGLRTPAAANGDRYGSLSLVESWVRLRTAPNVAKVGVKIRRLGLGCNVGNRLGFSNPKVGNNSASGKEKTLPVAIVTGRVFTGEQRRQKPAAMWGCVHALSKGK
jgi:hypothetical protein